MAAEQIIEAREPHLIRLARLESDLAHLAQTMLLNEKGHATVHDYARLREIAERVEGADDE